MRHLLLAMILTALVAPSSALAQSAAPFCSSGQSPRFAFGFEALREQVGNPIGDPVECEHANPDNGDTLQKTTTGLAFYRRATNTPTFTNGSEHWALTTEGLITWYGSAVDPPNSEEAAPQQDDVDYWRQLLSTLPMWGSGLDPQPITTFRGALRLPSQSNAFTAGFSPSYAWVDKNSYIAFGAPTYSVVLGPSPGDSNITFWGTSGRARWAEDQRPPEGCERFTGSYCPYTPYVQGAPIIERFTDLTVGSFPAMAVHGTCCNGENWLVEWYEPSAEVTYGVNLYLQPAQALGAQGLSPNHVDEAHTLAGAASELVAVRL